MPNEWIFTSAQAIQKQLDKSNILPTCFRFHWVQMDVLIFLLKSCVIDLLELQTISDYSVSNVYLNSFLFHSSFSLLVLDDTRE